MPLQKNAGDCARRTQKTLQRKLAAGVELGVEQIGLNQLTDVEQAALESGFGRLEHVELRLHAKRNRHEIACGVLARTGSGCNYAAWSDDGGDTWSRPEPTTQTAACSSLTLKTLPDGRLITFYNHAKPLHAGAFFPRTPLCYAVSADGGRTWGEPVVVDDAGVEKADRQNIYPSVCFTDEGMLVVYSTHEADPHGSFAGQYSHLNPDCGGKRCLLAYPE